MSREDHPCKQHATIIKVTQRLCSVSINSISLEDRILLQQPNAGNKLLFYNVVL